MLWCYSNIGDKVSMCHFKEVYFGLIFLFWGGGYKGSQNGLKVDPKLFLNGPKMIPNGPPPLHPHPRRQQKSRTRGADKLEKNIFLIFFYDLYERS